MLDVYGDRKRLDYGLYTVNELGQLEEIQPEDYDPDEYMPPEKEPEAVAIRLSVYPSTIQEGERAWINATTKPPATGASLRFEVVDPDLESFTESIVLNGAGEGGIMWTPYKPGQWMINGSLMESPLYESSSETMQVNVGQSQEPVSEEEAGQPSSEEESEDMLPSLDSPQEDELGMMLTYTLLGCVSVALLMGFIKLRRWTSSAYRKIKLHQVLHDVPVGFVFPSGLALLRDP